MNPSIALVMSYYDWKTAVSVAKALAAPIPTASPTIHWGETLNNGVKRCIDSKKVGDQRSIVDYLAR